MHVLASTWTVTEGSSFLLSAIPLTLAACFPLPPFTFQVTGIFQLSRALAMLAAQRRDTAAAAAASAEVVGNGAELQAELLQPIQAVEQVGREWANEWGRGGGGARKGGARIACVRVCARQSMPNIPIEEEMEEIRRR